MLELAVKGSKRYYGWMALLLGIAGVGFLVYLKQLDFGLGITGMSRDVSWGFYIANFTFLVGVAAGGVMVVLPYYLHDYKAYGKVTILGEFLAIASVVMCITFILVDLGQPMRVMNVLLYPTPELGAVLGHHRAERLPVPEPDHRLERARGGAQRRALPELAQAAHLPFDPLGGQHPHRHRLPVLRPARPGLLADRHPGPALPVVGLRLGAGAVDPAVPGHPPRHQLRPGLEADPVAGRDRRLRHLHQRVLPAVRGVRGLLQRDPRAHGPPHLPVRRGCRAKGPTCRGCGPRWRSWSPGSSCS